LPLEIYRRPTIARPPHNQPAPSRDGPRVNFEINVPQVRVIDQNGEPVGILPTREAIAKAEAVGLDLVEVSPNATPPVCKILNFGKYRYEIQKKKAEARKNQKVIEIKEVKLRPGIEENDYQVKLRAMKRFIEDGDKVKITLRFRGREMEHQHIAVAVLERTKNDLMDYCKIESMPRLEGRQMIMMIGPKT
jgi:translation initiation factor IF-3